MALRKTIKNSKTHNELDLLIERIEVAAKIARVKPETVCYSLFGDRHLIPKLQRARARLVTRRAKVEHYIEARGGEAMKLGEGDAK